MKEGWIYKKIKDVAVVVGGTTPSTANPEFWGGDLCWISPAELHGEHYLYDSVKKITAKAVASKSLKELPVGTVILSSRAPIGKVAINKVPMYCNQGFKCVICGPDLLNEYLYWWFRGKKDYLNSLGTGATFAEISKTVVENISIPVPPLPEQQRIVSRLDSAFANIDALKANATRQLSEARKLFQKALEEAMTPKEGWEEKTLKEIAQIKIGPFGSLLHKKDYISGGIPLVNPVHMIEGKIKANHDFSISEDKAKELSNYILKENDIILARRGEVGRCALVSSNENNYLCGTGSMFVRFDKEVDYSFMLLMFSSKMCKDYLEKHATGATMLNINSVIVSNMPLMLPPLPTQQAIVTRLDSLSANIRALEEVLQKIIAECDALKQAMLRQVFE